VTKRPTRLIPCPAKVVAMVRAALGPLSFTAEAQIQYLIDHRVDADELALQLNDVIPFLTELVQQGNAPKVAADLIRAIDARFSAMSGSEHADKWTEEALIEAVEWAEIRTLARSALQAIADATP